MAPKAMPDYGSKQQHPGTILAVYIAFLILEVDQVEQRIGL